MNPYDAKTIVFWISADKCSLSLNLHIIYQKNIIRKWVYEIVLLAVCRQQPINVLDCRGRHCFSLRGLCLQFEQLRSRQDKRKTKGEHKRGCCLTACCLFVSQHVIKHTKGCYHSAVSFPNYCKTLQ